MKLLRHGDFGQEKPGIIDQDGKIRDLSKHISDINGNTISSLSEGIYNIWVISAGCNYQDTIEIVYNSCSSVLIQPIGCDPSIAFSATASNLLSGNYTYTYELLFLSLIHI